MKKAFYLLLFLLFSLSDHYAHFVDYCMASAASPSKIQSFEGTVEVYEKEGAAPLAARVGMALAPSYIITTGSHSYCVVKLDDHNAFRIKQNARVILEKIWEESSKLDGKVVSEVRLNMMRGELTAKLDKMPENSEFNVEGPVAIAGASGTAYTVHVDPESQSTAVTVLDHEVRVESRNEPNKFIQIQKFEQVNVSPWENALLREIGRGVLSENILGKQFVQELEQNIQIQAIGTGSTEDQAKLQSLSKLSRLVSLLSIDRENTLESLLSQDQILTQKVYQAIAQAKIVGSIQNQQGTFQVKSQISLINITEIIGRPLFGMTQSVMPMTLAEYSSKFGALARVTTQRAAQVEGYRNLAEMIYGTVINSTTTVEDFAVKDDTVRTTVQGVVKGALIVDTQYFSDGSVIVTMEIRGNIIPQSLGPITGDVFGKNYLSGPELIEFGNFEDYLDLEKSGKW